MSRTPDLHLISFDICPYVERSRVVLLEKGVDFKQTFVDLSDKPDWFLKISPRGKVPVLVVDERPVFESAVINELLEELIPEPPMMPADPLTRAEARSWIVFNNDVLMPAAAKLWFAAKTDEALEQGRVELRRALERVEAFLSSHDHRPYFMGEAFTLVDATYAPLFTRWEATEALGHTDLLEGLPYVAAYREALLARPSVQAARAKDLTEKTVAYRRRRG